MAYLSEKPTVTPATGHMDGYVFNHPAYGVITLSNVSGEHTLFGSDLGHSSAMRIQVRRAELTRSLSSDWIHGREVIVDFELSYAQFAQFITSQGSGNGTPVTLRCAPEKGTSTVSCPSIENIQSKAETCREEIKASAKESLAGVQAQLNRLEALLAEGAVSKKDLKEIHFKMKCQVENLPANLAYTVESAEKALETATHHAKIEVESYVQQTAQRLGLAHISQMGQLENKG